MVIKKIGPKGDEVIEARELDITFPSFWFFEPSTVASMVRLSYRGAMA